MILVIQYLLEQIRHLNCACDYFYVFCILKFSKSKKCDFIYFTLQWSAERSCVMEVFRPSVRPSVRLSVCLCRWFTLIIVSIFLNNYNKICSSLNQVTKSPNLLQGLIPKFQVE